ncbi:DNA-binding transcriptional regulator, XRE-family HTH domain [Butyrivibrio sp. YAB3001]|nr:DNA-binding transcriptional regulator, XRE-family HTH domain [Butyrivibrio sp. YAB3001]
MADGSYMHESEFKKEFAARLAVLRNNAGVSARDMSLSLGQNPGYINNIENLKTLPSMTMFFKICDFLRITPADFFDTFKKKGKNSKVGELSQILEFLDSKQVDALYTLVSELNK